MLMPTLHTYVGTLVNLPMFITFSLCIHMHSLRYYISLSIDWRVVEEHFNNILHHSNQGRLKPGLLKDGGEQLSNLVSTSSANIRNINERIITYLIVKLCYNDTDAGLVRLCDVMDESIDRHTDMQQSGYGECIWLMQICTFLMHKHIVI